MSAVPRLRRGVASGLTVPPTACRYLDARNNFHVLYHVYNITTPCVACDSPIVSGHDFSEDGLTWYSAPGQPFGNQYTTTDGHTVTVSTRERPKLMFDASGTPTHLINGVRCVTGCVRRSWRRCLMSSRVSF